MAAEIAFRGGVFEWVVTDGRGAVVDRGASESAQAAAAAVLDAEAVTGIDAELVADQVCADCGAEPRRLSCYVCGGAGLVTDCGHQEQPRPIAADERGRAVCERCV